MGRESIFEGESNNTLNLRRLMNPELDRAQARSLAYEINHDFKRFAMAVSIKNLDGDITKQAIFSESGKRIRGKTAERTFCHKNTVRYRLGKIQERMCLTHSDKEFYQELSFAIRAYLFSKKLEQYEE